VDIETGSISNLLLQIVHYATTMLPGERIFRCWSRKSWCISRL